ncbi:MAG: hypothetical protein ACC630_02900 [Nitrospinota bacterium]
MNILKTGRDPPQADKTKDIVFPGQNKKKNGGVNHGHYKKNYIFRFNGFGCAKCDHSLDAIRYG